jgi:hypothetical protein
MEVGTHRATPQDALFHVDEHQKALVLRELQLILAGRAFQGSKRCQEFLSYVVEYTLHGHLDYLKERTIGVELFQRPPEYTTGEDPVVRVRASEVRRRLNQYYAEENSTPEVRIEIPVGSYIPRFHWKPPEEQPPKEQAPKEETRSVRTYYRFHLVLVALAASALTALLALVLGGHKRMQPASAVDEFWAPLFKTSQPVLICLPTVVVYQPSLGLYQRYSQAHPSEFQTADDRLTRVLPLDPNATLNWKDMLPLTTSYVAKEDAYVAAQLTALFDRMNKPRQMRNGTDLSFEDLRNSPAVLIGAFNNRWTLEMTAHLPFFFANEGEFGKIQERKVPGRTWRPQLQSRTHWTTDFAVVARLFDSNTGQLLIVAAGVGGRGTSSAGEFLSRDDYLAEGLRGAPTNWNKKNMEIVLQTNITDGLAGPPHVVATEFW